MKRSKSLMQLSREHHAALVLAKRAQRLGAENIETAGGFMAELAEVFAFELEPHFQVEEKLLLPALRSAGAGDIAQRTLADHEELRALSRRISQTSCNDFASLGRFGLALEAHVRFEERELFPLAESLLSPEVLAILEEQGAQPQGAAGRVCGARPEADIPFG